jgi:hypothetical protein
LRRAATITTAASLLLTAGFGVVASGLAPFGGGGAWASAPLSGLAQAVEPAWARTWLTLAVVIAGALLLGQSVRAGIWGAESALVSLAGRGLVAQRMRDQDARVGTYMTAIDAAVMTAALAMIASGASITWLGCAYATAVLWTLALQTAVVRQLAGRRRIGLALLAGLFVAAALAMLIRGDAGAVAATLTLGTAAGVLALRKPQPSPDNPEDADAAELLTSSAVHGGDLEPMPGCVLVPVRNPHLLGHLTAALQGPRERPIVVMTVRMLGSDSVEHATLPRRSSRPLSGCARPKSTRASRRPWRPTSRRGSSAKHGSARRRPTSRFA